MKKLLLIAIAMLLLVTFSPSNVFAKGNPITITPSGIVQSYSRTVDRQDKSNIYITETKGKPAKASIEISDDKMSGTVAANGIEYKLEGQKADVADFARPRFEGSVLNQNALHFEAFLLENNNAVINIFGLSDKGDRIDPFSVKLDGSNPQVTKSQIQDRIPDVPMLREDSNFATFAASYGWGISMEVQGYYGLTSTPYIARLWTDPDAPEYESEQPYITRTNILQAKITKSASSGSTFQPVNPSADGSTSFTVRFTVSGVTITIPVTTSSTQINPDGFGNPHEVTYTWTLRHAYVYEEGSDSEGILAEHVYWLGSAVPNQYGYYESNVSGRLWYEVVGAWREYFDYSTSLGIWYN